MPWIITEITAILWYYEKGEKSEKLRRKRGTHKIIEIDRPLWSPAPILCWIIPILYEQNRRIIYLSDSPTSIQSWQILPHRTQASI